MSIALKNIIIVGLLIFFSQQTLSQTIHVSGRVSNEKGEPIERVNVLLKRISKGSIIAFAQTSESGDFDLKKNIAGIHSDSLELSFSCIGYAPSSLPIPKDNQLLLVKLKVKDVEIREVVVSAQKIIQRRDTITYLVSSFSSADDRTIADVLKKIPGIEVLETGEIEYQGQKLNKFYIEGSDLLEGRYALATNNISHTDVASVEVMENHQPIKALEDLVYSGSPAMNIKLKEDAKSRWAGTLKGGAGIPELWVAEAFAMRFKKKTQSLNTYKGNNTGNESFEMNVFSSVSDFTPSTKMYFPTYIQVSPSLASGIGSRRSTFNKTNNITTNNLYKVGKDFDLTSEFTGTLDRRESAYTSRTSYFLAKEQVVIEDKTEKANDLKKALSGKIRLKSNQEKLYFNNNLNFSYERNDPSIVILGTLPNRQNAGVETWKIRNDFDILKRTNDKVFTFRSGNEYTSKPQSLELVRTEKPTIREDIKMSSFLSDNTMDYSFLIGKIRVQSPIRLLYQYRTIENRLDEEINSLNFHKLKLEISPSAEYQINDFHFSLSSPLFYQTLSLEKKQHQFYGINPCFTFDWIASSRLKVSSYLSYMNDLPDENLFYHGQILNNYRNLTVGYIDFSTGECAVASINLEYKDVIKMLFSHLELTWMSKEYTKISGQEFKDDFILNYYYPGNRKTETLFVSGSVTKGIEGINGSVLLSPSFVQNRSSLVRNEVTLPYSSESYSIKGRLASTIARKINLTYEVLYSHNKYKMENDRKYMFSNRMAQSLKITYSPIKALQMSYTFDHYCNHLDEDNYKNFFLSDFSISWLLGSRWELAMSVHNILDEKYYSYFIESELTSFYQSYTIRPRNTLLTCMYRF